MEMVTNMFSKMNTNDLKSLKKHLEKDNDALKSYKKAVEYDYDVDPQIYREDSDGVDRYNPDKSFSSIGIGADSGANSMMSSMMSTNVFYRCQRTQVCTRSSMMSRREDGRKNIMNAYWY